ILSELLPDTPCNSDYFKFRNRIISGLSKGTVVLGGYNGSGSLITANHAFEQDREVFFTIPDDTLDKKFIVSYAEKPARALYRKRLPVGMFFIILSLS
ncbi:DNA-processing protein DprA, partial [[Eubacterium] siraeum]|nr:DNA-processing protein DprA [[Eubacterium] siraeum]